jgi:hypothetical protein
VYTLFYLALPKIDLLREIKRAKPELLQITYPEQQLYRTEESNDCEFTYTLNSNYRSKIACMRFFH